uniref:Prostaglandin G/H synthase 1 n=1 Tax=Cyprinus carpio TaxID=7962 RepID=A0A8C1XCM9_CYPCA
MERGREREILVICCTVLNPCCYYPCQNRGICVRYGLDRYECDCTRTGFYGENCTIPEFWSRVFQLLKPSPNAVHYILTNFDWLWDIINRTFLRDWLMHKVLTVRANLIPSPPTYNSKYDYLNWEAYSNITYYTRLLPPVPQDCPKPLGTKGKMKLPDPKLLVEKFMLRRNFRPDPQGTNLMFAFFAQHFTHQFFRTHNRVGLGFTKGLAHGVDAGHIYGDTLDRQLDLRLHKDGKLKYQVVNGEIYPPTVLDAPVKMSYPPSVPPEQQLAIGQEVYGLLPGLSMYATLWLREHNRVCDILKQEHPTWGDEQLFQTSRLIIIGTINAERYIQVLEQHMLPSRRRLFQGRPCIFQHDNARPHTASITTSWLRRITIRVLKWPPCSPDLLPIDNIWRIIKRKMRQRRPKTVEQLEIGGGHNIHPVVRKVAEGVIIESRELRLQPFNEYRKRFNLKPYTSFSEFTGEEEMAKVLEKLYGHIDALEFYPALLLEKTRPGAIFGESMVEMGAPFSLKGLMGNPICSPEYWKPSTFGGKTGFDIVNSATLKKLVCLNTKWCPYVSFHTPPSDYKQQRTSHGEL